MVKRRKPRRGKGWRECSKATVAKYEGKRDPYCNNGRGCPACWAKREAYKHDVSNQIGRFSDSA